MRYDLITYFIWNYEDEDEFVIEASHEHKCPVCGMFVYKYPKCGQL